MNSIQENEMQDISHQHDNNDLYQIDDVEEEDEEGNNKEGESLD